MLAEETPVALVYNGISHAVMMASPADLEDFALGFSLSEGIADDKTDIGAIEAVAVDRRHRGAHRAVLARLLAPEGAAAHARRPHRLRPVRGRQPGADGARDCEPVTADLKVSLDAIHRALDNLPEAQINNRATRSMHAAAFATPQGELKLVREDVGRHNALDKLIGAMLRGGLDPATGVCLITSRCSYEMVQKAVVTGFPILAAVSAPTLMARRLAEAHNLTLIALARHDSAVLVSHPERVY